VSSPELPARWASRSKTELSLFGLEFFGKGAAKTAPFFFETVFGSHLHDSSVHSKPENDQDLNALVDHFEIPQVPDIAETCPERFEAALAASRD